MARYQTIDDTEFNDRISRIDAGIANNDDRAVLTKHFLALIADKAPGSAVELRIPPFGAVQIVSGTQHTRGTPPAVVELDPDTWIALARGTLDWEHAEKSVSGERSDISGFLPIFA